MSLFPWFSFFFWGGGVLGAPVAYVTAGSSEVKLNVTRINSASSDILTIFQLNGLAAVLIQSLQFQLSHRSYGIKDALQISLRIKEVRLDLPKPPT